MDTTPVTLLERLRTPGDEDAWRRLVDLVTPLLLGWSRRVGLSDHDAADLAQDVLTILTEQLPTFEYDPQRSFRAWLKTIAMNKWRERSRRPPAISLDGTGMLDDIPGPDPDATWENEYRYQLVVQTLQAIQDEFQPRTWQACWEVVARGRPSAEVAAELGMTPGALYAAKCRTRSPGTSGVGPVERRGARSRRRALGNLPAMRADAVGEQRFRGHWSGPQAFFA